MPRQNHSGACHNTSPSTPPPQNRPRRHLRIEPTIAHAPRSTYPRSLPRTLEYDRPENRTGGQPVPSGLCPLAFRTVPSSLERNRRCG
eukprot:scaffold2124_cov90-Isochrysis_galbana.AAC.5